MAFTSSFTKLLSLGVLIETDLERYERFIEEVFSSDDYQYRPFYFHSTATLGITIYAKIGDSQPCFGWYAFQENPKTKPVLKYFLNPRKYPQYTTAKILPFKAKEGSRRDLKGNHLTTNKKKGSIKIKGSSNESTTPTKKDIIA